MRATENDKRVVLDATSHEEHAEKSDKLSGLKAAWKMQWVNRKVEEEENKSGQLEK